MNNFRRIANCAFRNVHNECRHLIKNRTISEFSTCLHKNLDVALIERSIACEVQFVRTYAKGKDKKKEKAKTKVAINENEMSTILNVESLKKHLERPLEVMKEEYIKQLSLRTSAGSIEMLTVNFEGKDYTVQEIAHIVRKNPTTLVINMSVFPQAIPTVVKAIQKSGFNLNPQQEGTTLYVPIPKVTQQHRENLSKTAKQLFIKCKDSIRDVQNKHTKSLKKKESFSEDFLRNVEQQIIAMADAYISQAETIYNTKSNELLGKS